MMDFRADFHCSFEEDSVLSDEKDMEKMPERRITDR